MPTEPTGHRLRGLLADRTVRILVVEASAPAEHTRAIHALGPDAARLGAEALLAAALASAHTKGDEQLTLQLQGEHPRYAVYVDATADGALRARVSPPDLVLSADRQLRGMLMVTKAAPGGELYRGATAVDHRNLEAAIGSHFGTSQQVDAIVRLGCDLSKTSREPAITSAHGLLIERLPPDPAGGIPSLSPEAFVERFGWVREAPLGDLMTSIAFGALGPEPIEVLERVPVRWRCRCSLGRIEQTLGSLGPEVLREMIEEDHGATVSCHFCSTAYVLSEEDLRRIAAR